MELKIDIGFDQLLYAVKQLPASQRAILKKELNQKTEVKDRHSEFRALLLNGPVFNEDQIELIAEARKSINKWRDE
ncbi:MAG: hypothetical protein V4594_14680 [Bacteroidota bacterium]